VSLELVLLDGTNRRFLLAEGVELTVGAAAHCGVRLVAPDVSRMHALVSCRRGRVVVMDLGSRNGTFVAGKRIGREVELAPGDTVSFSSVAAQLVPAMADSDPHEPPRPSTPVPSRSDRPTQSHATERLDDLVEDGLVSLMARWADSATSARPALVDWLVSRRGMLGAAIVEVVGGEVNVVAACGALTGRLPEVGTLKSIAARAGRVPETVSFQLGELTVLAVSAAGLPWLLIAPGSGTPDLGQLELLSRLLAVAGRIDHGSGARRRVTYSSSAPS
jgi:hypothetical protein